MIAAVDAEPRGSAPPAARRARPHRRRRVARRAGRAVGVVVVPPAPRLPPIGRRDAESLYPAAPAGSRCRSSGHQHRPRGGYRARLRVCQSRSVLARVPAPLRLQPRALPEPRTGDRARGGEGPCPADRGVRPLSHPLPHVTRHQENRHVRAHCLAQRAATAAGAHRSQPRRARRYSRRHCARARQGIRPHGADRFHAGRPPVQPLSIGRSRAPDDRSRGADCGRRDRAVATSKR